MSNVPDWWHTATQTCPDCGEVFHASEGWCDCWEAKLAESAGLEPGSYEIYHAIDCGCISCAPL